MNLFETTIDLMMKMSFLYIFYNFVDKMNVFNVLENLYYQSNLVLYNEKLNDFLLFVNKELYPFLYDIFENQEDSCVKDTTDNHTSSNNNKLVKYEDKYLKEIREMSNDYDFNEVELEMVNMTMREFYRALVDTYVNDINIIKDEIITLNNEISELEEYDSTDSKSSDGIIENKKKDLFEKVTQFTEKIAEIENELSNKSKMETTSLNNAKEEVYKIRLDKLVNCILIEKTPLGNVIMFYNNKRGAFEYFSDNTIPYRYLETVGRKYVKTFNCRRIYYDMEEELRLYEEKIKQKEMIDRENLERELKSSGNNNTLTNNKKEKSVFAKFKGYNKESGTGHVSTAPPPKNSIPNNNINTNKKNENVLLKENANRYTHEGKLTNFSILKRVALKAIDKKYAMTFADFKKMKKN
jgi:hypothetical protein